MPAMPAPGTRELLVRLVDAWRAMLDDADLQPSRDMLSTAVIIEERNLTGTNAAAYTRHGVVPLIEELLATDSHLRACCPTAFQLAEALENLAPVPPDAIWFDLEPTEAAVDLLVARLFEAEFAHEAFVRVFNLAPGAEPLPLPKVRASLQLLPDRDVAALTGTPQGGIISPLLANVYLSALDRHFERARQHQTRYPGCTTYYRRRGHATYRLVRYADDFVILVRGTREQAEAIRDEAARVLRDELKMELSAEKTLVTHVDAGFDFLGHRIRRVPWGGTRVGWTYPSKKSLAAITRKIKRLTTRLTTYLSLRHVLLRLNPVLRGWCMYFRHGASKRTFAYVDAFAWRRVFRWLRKKHPQRTWKYLRERYCGGRWAIQEQGVDLFRPSRVPVERYRYRGTRIPLPWMAPEELGRVGRFARRDADEPSVLGALEEALTVG